MINRYTPRKSLPVWAQPDMSGAPEITIPGRHEVELLEEDELGWARVRWGDGHEGWVDGRNLASTPPKSPRWKWIAVGAGIVLLGGGAVAAVLLIQDDGEVGAVATTSATQQETTPSATDGSGPDQTEVEATEPTEAVPTTQAVSGVFDVDEAVIEQAIAEAAATPLESIEQPSRNVLATSLLVDEFATSGMDLTGLELIVYPFGPTESVLVMITDDSSALINTDDGSDLLVTQLLGSPTVAQFEIEQLVIQHSTSDDQGPLVVSMAVAMSDLQEAFRTGADVFDRIAVQVERTG